MTRLLLKKFVDYAAIQKLQSLPACYYCLQNNQHCYLELSAHYLLYNRRDDVHTTKTQCRVVTQYQYGSYNVCQHLRFLQLQPKK